ncbi:MAG: N-methyl-D-aspartate receptor NMDAR2C subunit [Verrucomicrobium sp.]
MSEARFESLWLALGLQGDAGACRQILADAYGQAGRGYHNLVHLDECLEELDRIRDLAVEPTLLELALWFHDVVYDARAADNEERSAELAREVLAKAGAEPRLIQRVKDLVMVTQHHQAAPGTDDALMIDVDLSILGKPWPRFEEYDRAIREEYAWVPEEIYAVKRREVLQRFLDRECIYLSEPMRQRYEAQARLNLERRLSMD